MEYTIKIKDDFGNDLVVGKLIDRTYITERQRSKHFFVKYDGWAIDRKVAEGIDAIRFVVKDIENGIEYSVYKNVFIENADVISNRGHREQLCLREELWEKVDIKAKQEYRDKVMKAFNRNRH